MSQQELLKQVASTLDKLNIDYMFTGSVVSSIQGEPRSTHDIDVVVSIKKDDVYTFIKSFPSPEFYLSEDSIIEAISTKRMFNLIDVNSGDKVDFWLLTDSPFDKSRFARRCTEEIFGIKVFLSRPEDTILAKLKWAKDSGGSEKQFTDALRVYELQVEEIDNDYLNFWAEKLCLKSLLQKLINDSE